MKKDLQAQPMIQSQSALPRSFATSRRRFSTLLFAVTLLTTGVVNAQTPPTVEMYKNPYCGCCGKWAEHLQKNGFKVISHDVDDISAKRASLGMPAPLASCHTAKVGNYLIEGHVPAADIHRLLKEKPQAIGLAAPGMPAGSPGMDVPNSPPYDTLLVSKDGSTRVFAKH